jgi:hypothetical protein
MTQPTTDEPTHGQGTRERFLEWSHRPASVTNGHLLASRIVWTAFLAISAFVGYRQLRLDNQVNTDRIEAAILRESDNCADRNARRDSARVLAEETLAADQASLDRDQDSLDNDVAIWTSIDDLFPEGIPEPARTTIFQGLSERQETIDGDQERLDGRDASIEKTYALEPCPGIAVDTASTDE